MRNKNRHILFKIIDCVKFRGAFELTLRGRDEDVHSENTAIFRWLVEFVGSPDAAVPEHLQGAAVFKGTLKTVQNEVSFLREHIIEEIRCADLF